MGIDFDEGYRKRNLNLDFDEEYLKRKMGVEQFEAVKAKVLSEAGGTLSEEELQAGIKEENRLEARRKFAKMKEDGLLEDHETYIKNNKLSEAEIKEYTEKVERALFNIRINHNEIEDRLYALQMRYTEEWIDFKEPERFQQVFNGMYDILIKTEKRLVSLLSEPIQILYQDYKLSQKMNEYRDMEIHNYFMKKTGIDEYRLHVKEKYAEKHGVDYEGKKINHKNKKESTK